jgi:hypothetical protein
MSLRDKRHILVMPPPPARTYWMPSLFVNKIRACLAISVGVLVVVQFSLPHNNGPSRQPDDMPVLDGGRQQAFLHSAGQVPVAKPKSSSTVDNTIAASLGPYCVVHIGKTAGGTLSCRFGTWLAKSCSQKYKEPSPFTAKVVGKFHKNRDWGCLKKRKKVPKIWLFTLRHPLDRIVSWFYYEHMDKANVHEIMGNRPLLYKDCFDSLDDLSQIGLKVALEYNGNNSTFVAAKNGQDPKRFSLVCAKRAWNAISGRVGYQYHNFYNYGYYKSWVDQVTGASSYNVLAIRSEHLEEDWGRLEYLYNNSNRRRRGQAPYPDPGHHHHHLDGTRDEHFSTAQRHGSNSSAVSPSSYPNLCRALCQEIKVYTNLLIQAINLTPKQIQESLNELYAKCPKWTVTHCDNNPHILDVVDKARIDGIPGFPKK